MSLEYYKRTFQGLSVVFSSTSSLLEDFRLTVTEDGSGRRRGRGRTRPVSPRRLGPSDVSGSRRWFLSWGGVRVSNRKEFILMCPEIFNVKEREFVDTVREPQKGCVRGFRGWFESEQKGGTTRRPKVRNGLRSPRTESGTRV